MAQSLVGTAPRPSTGLRARGGTPVREPVPSRVARSGEVLDLVRSGAAVTTSEIAATMGVSRSTVTERVDLLVQHRLLVPDGASQTGRGRPSVRYAFHGGAGLTLAAQVGLSGTRVAVTDLDGTVLVSRTVDVDLHLGPEEVLATVVAALEEQLAAVTGRCGTARVHGVGVGVPGPVELATTCGPSGAADHPWEGFDVAGHLSASLGLPVYVDQDVNLLALGEHRSGWPDARVFLCVKVGTAIGCGILVDGKVLRGGTGLAGEIGHTAVAGSTRQCACGNRGCLNAVASGAALVPALADLGVQVASTREIARRAMEGDVTVAQVVRQAGREVGDVLAGAINLLNPDVVVVWGYLADARDHLLAGIRESVYAKAVPAASQGLSIVRAALGNDAGIHGAATTIIEQTLRPEAVDAFISRERTRPA